jgi:hypothetical protein
MALGRHMRFMRLDTLWRFLLCAAICAGALGGCTREKDQLDNEVRSLCAKDGGERVFEQVRLAAENFDESGFINFYRRMSKDPLGQDFIFESRMDYYRKGNPEMWRNYYRVIRKNDGKVLGESVSYSRRGGDLPGPWHESSFGCPANISDATLLRKVFVNSNSARAANVRN